MQFKKFLLLFFIVLQNAYGVDPYPTILERILHQLPEWEKFNSKVQIEEIETGLTHRNFKVNFLSAAYFIRMASDRPDLLGLDSEREYVCTQKAAALGIAPEVLLYYPSDQIMVMPFISSKAVEKNCATYKRMLVPLRQFHHSGITLPNTFCPYGVIYDYYQHTVDLDCLPSISWPSSLLSVVEEIRKVAPSYRELVPCHLDLFYKNFLDDGKKIWIIDWEYSAMADPLYDVATWASANFLSLPEMQELLQLYLLNSPTLKEFAYFYLMSILVDIRWGLWSLIQAEVSQIKASYLDYANDAFHQAWQKIAHPQYRQSLQLLQEG